MRVGTIRIRGLCLGSNMLSLLHLLLFRLALVDQAGELILVEHKPSIVGLLANSV